MLAEIAARRGFGAVQPGAEVHLVQIQLEDLVLGVFVLDQRGEDHLLQLAGVGLLQREETHARELLRDRAGALRAVAFAEVRDRRAGHANEVDALMIVEALILDREHRLLEIAATSGRAAPRCAVP